MREEVYRHTMFGAPLDWMARMGKVNVMPSKGELKTRQIHHLRFAEPTRIEHEVKLGPEGEGEQLERAKRSLVHPVESTAQGYLQYKRMHSALSHVIEALPLITTKPELRQNVLDALAQAGEELKSPQEYSKRELKRAIKGNVIDPNLKAEKALAEARRKQERLSYLEWTQTKFGLETSELEELTRLREWISTGKAEKVKRDAVDRQRILNRKTVKGKRQEFLEIVEREIVEHRQALTSLKADARKRVKQGKPVTKELEKKISSLEQKIATKRREKALVNRSVRQVLGAFDLINGYQITRLKGKRRKPYSVALKNNVKAAENKLKYALQSATDRLDLMERHIIPVLGERIEHYNRWTKYSGRLSSIQGHLEGAAMRLHTSASEKECSAVFEDLKQHVYLPHFKKVAPTDLPELHRALSSFKKAGAALSGNYGKGIVGTHDPVEAKQHLLDAVKHVKAAQARLDADKEA